MRFFNLFLVAIMATVLSSQMTAQQLAYTPQFQSKKEVKGKGKSKSSDMAFSEGKVIVGVGYGIVSFGNVFKSLLSDYVDVSAKNFGPLFVKLEYGISDKVSMGLNINYTKYSASFKTTDPYTGTASYSSPSVIFRSNFHFSTSEKLDPYWGIGVGYRRYNIKYADNDPNTDDSDVVKIPFGFTFDAGIGLRYFFTPNLGAFIEAGISRSPIHFGLVGSF